MATFEMEALKIGQVCKMYNINLENLLRELNSVRNKISKRSKKLLKNKERK